MQPKAKPQKIKTKVRFTSLDVAAIVAQLQCLIGLRISNIYDINPTTYIFKIAKSEEKYQLLIENGVRFHLATQSPDKKAIPSGFTMKFRKFLRSKRVQSIRQVGVERVVVFTFGSQNFTNHLILQLYSQGNIILTDQNYKILQCIRSHQFSQKIKTAVGQIYPFEQAANIYLENINISPQAINQTVQNMQAVQPQAQNNKKKKQSSAIKDVIFKLIPCLFPTVIEHLLVTAGIDPQGKIQSQQSKNNIIKGAQYCFQFLSKFIKNKQKGYLYSKGQDYFEFSPYPNCRLANHPCTQLASFNQSVAQYFTKYKKTLHQQEQAFEQLAWRKYEQIKRDQQQRMKKLIQQQQTYGGKAHLIESNVQQIDAILKIVNTMQSNGFSWDNIERMVGQSKKTGDPLANMIHQMNPQKRQITVLLGDKQESQLCALIPVELMVDYNGYTNAEMYYSGRKKQKQKEQRTKEASQQVLKLAEKDALKNIQKKKNQLLIKAVPTRKQLWFQKFYWFISSQGWLVISGRDSHQNELLVKRYMKAGDLYMHSDYGGAASTIIKGPPKSQVAPRMTLEQAAIFTVCRSKAWDTKIISSAWWVYHDQVSKSAPTGEFLPTGSFMIRGKRNFIHPNRMEMGMTLLYRLDNQSMLRHMEKRMSRMGQGDQGQGVKKQANQREVSKEDEQYAIIDLEAQARLARQDKKNKLQKGPKGQPKIPQANIQLVKKLSSQQEKLQDSEQIDSDSSQQRQTRKQQKKQIKKDNKKQSKQQEAPQQKHKNRNKKKLKKLQKYMQQQDEQEREIIMKMLGAKQMKHKRQQQQEQVNVKDQKGKKQQKKKGIDKYLNLQENQGNNIDTDKVLFLKGKNKGKDQEEQQEEIKQNKQKNSKKTQKIQQLSKQSVKTQKVQQPVQQNKVQSTQQQQNQQQTESTTQKDQAKPQEQEQLIDSQQQPEPQQQKAQQKVQEQIIDQKIVDSQLAQLPRLAGQLMGNDQWDALIPMCAPYPTIKDNIFKVKLVPGGLKKGKAARNIQGYFTTLPDLDENQKAFIRALPQQQIINAVIGNVKLAGAGLLKIQQKAKADKKEKRKEQDKKEA